MDEEPIDTAKNAVSHPSAALLTAYGEAHAALARLDERRRWSPVREALRARQERLELSALAWLDGAALDLDRWLMGDELTPYSISGEPLRWIKAFGRPLPREAFASAPAILDWLGVRDAALDAPLPYAIAPRPRRDMLERMRGWCAAFPHGWKAPPLLAGGRMAHGWRVKAMLGRGDALAAVLLGDRWGPGAMGLSSGGLIAIGLQSQGPAWIKAQRPASIDRVWLDAVQTAANRLLHLEQQFRLYRTRCDAVLEGKRKSNRLGALLTFAMGAPDITARLARRRLGLSEAGAKILLDEAVDRGLLIERTGQASYRRYSVPVDLR
jgi:hypothetical protein